MLTATVAVGPVAVDDAMEVESEVVVVAGNIDDTND